MEPHRAVTPSYQPRPSLIKDRECVGPGFPQNSDLRASVGQHGQPRGSCARCWEGSRLFNFQAQTAVPILSCTGGEGEPYLEPRGTLHESKILQTRFLMCMSVSLCGKEEKHTQEASALGKKYPVSGARYRVVMACWEDGGGTGACYLYIY